MNWMKISLTLSALIQPQPSCTGRGDKKKIRRRKRMRRGKRKEEGEEEKSEKREGRRGRRKRMRKEKGGG